MEHQFVGSLVGGSWIAVVAAFFGAGTGYLLTFWREKAARERRIRSCWSAVRSEIKICSRMADDYLNPPIVKAPSYRWPTLAYQHAFPELLLGAGLNTDEVGALLSYFIDVEAINRGLDRAQELNASGMLVELNLQFGTNVNRVQKHLHEKGNWYGPAMAVIDKHYKE